ARAVSMTNYEIHGPARTCAASGRELRPGDKVFSVLWEEADRFVRKDYAAEAWPGPPNRAIAWWVGQIPETGRHAKPTINDDLLVDCFEHLADTTHASKLRFRYVVALLLMRRKRFRFEDARSQGEQETLVV